MVFCDVSKAFDWVWHKGLIFKLKQYGIEGELLKWISNYLDDRKEWSSNPASQIIKVQVSAGVSQMSVFGPLLFFIYDISDSLLSLTRLFANDSSLFYSASSIHNIT